jgi:heat-inducible transcriptional repressor
MLNERNRKILCAIVRSYINNPEPVGSGLITKKYSFNLSSATIRNIMSDLEDMGFLSQPHISAGRVPTDKGYRLYVNSICSEEDEQPDDRVSVYDLLKELEAIKNDIGVLLNETAKRLSNFSHYLGIALSPRAGMSIFNRIELFKHRGKQIVTLFFTEEGLVKNKILDIGFDISQRDLNRISAYLNSEFHGHCLDEIRSMILKEMAKEKDLCDTLISRAIRICKEALFFPYDDIFISGFSEVLGLPDFSDVEKIKEISRAIEDKHLILKLLDRLIEMDGVQVIIGSENPFVEMKGLSVVASTYKEGNRPIGCIGMIGPTRMDYLKAMEMVDTASRFITRVISER